MSDEQQIFDYLKEGDEEAFSSLFRKYYRDLVLFAGTILPDRKELCEDIVQNVFTDLWNRRNETDCFRYSEKRFSGWSPNMAMRSAT